MNATTPGRQGFSLNFKICALATGLTVAALGLTAGIIGYKNTQVAEKTTMEQVQTSTRELARSLETRLATSHSAVAAMAKIIQTAKQEGVVLDREQIASVVKATLKGSEDFIGAAVTFEPNALDGEDKAFAGKSPWYDESGRYMPYWSKNADGTLSVEPTVFEPGAGANPWYEVPKASGKDYFTEPYLYKVNGKEVLMASMVSPILVDGKFQGAASADFTVAQLSKVLGSGSPVEEGQLTLVTAAGRPVARQGGQPLDETTFTLPPAALQKIQEGASYQFTDIERGLVTLWEPVRSGPSTAPWSLQVTFPLAVATAASRQLLEYTLIVSVLCAIGVAGLLFLGLNRLTAPVRALAKAMTGLANGTQGLTARLNQQGSDELAQIATGFNEFVSRIQTVVGAVQTNADAVAMASAEIAAGNSDLSARTETQAGAIQQTASAMSQLNQQVSQNAKASAQASVLAHTASLTANKGGEAVATVVETMKEINESSARIAAITGVIDGIAFQTNILALNAAVEAARAGEEGRGFAVVASEVRSLAGRSAQAAKEISALISASVQHVEKGTAQVDAAGATLKTVVSAIEEVSALTKGISEASAEQARGVSQISVAVTQMDETTQQNAALVEEMAAAAAGLTTQAAALSGVVNSFHASEKSEDRLKATPAASLATPLAARHIREKSALVPSAPVRVIAQQEGSEDWETF